MEVINNDDSGLVARTKINDNFADADQRYTFPFPQFETSTSTTNYVGTPNPVITAYASGQKFQVKIHATSTGDATLNLNGLGTRKIFITPVIQATTDDLVENSIYLLVYDQELDSGLGGFLMMSGGGGGGASPFKGVYVDLATLQAEVPESDAGDYAFVDAGSGSAPDIYIWDDSDNEWVLGSNGGGGFGLLGRGFWRFSTTTTPAPTSGQIRFNNATMASVTQLFLHEISDESADVSNFLATLSVGDIFYIQQKNDSTRWMKAVVNALPTDNGTYWTIPVTVHSTSGLLPVNNSPTLVRLTSGVGISQFSTEYFTGNNVATVFTIPGTGTIDIVAVYVGGQRMKEGVQYSKSNSARTVTLVDVVPTGIGIDVEYLTNILDITSLAHWSETDWGVARVATIAETNAGVIDDRGVTPLKLAGWWTNVKTLAQTFAAKITFSTAPRHNHATANTILGLDANKDMISAIPATQAELIAGTDTVKYVNSAGLEAKRSIKTKSVTNSATGANPVDCESKQEVKVMFTVTVTGNITLSRTNDSNLEILTIIMPISGTATTITCPSDTRMARYNEVVTGDGWYQTSKILQVSSVTAGDLHELSFIKNGSVFLLQYDGPYRA